MVLVFWTSIRKQNVITIILILCVSYHGNVESSIYWEEANNVTYCTLPRDKALPDPDWGPGNCTPKPEDYLKCVYYWTNASATTARIRTHYLNRTDAAISDYVIYVGRPLIYCIGLVFNILSICVFSQKELRQVATCQFMIAIAVFDILTILNGFFYWIEYELLVPVMTAHVALCKISVFTVYCGPEMSAITLTLMSAERLLRNMNTAAHERWFSIKRTSLYIVAIVLAMVLLNTYIFVSDIFFKECCKNVCWNIYHDGTDMLELREKNCREDMGNNCGIMGALAFYSVYRWVALSIYWILPFVGLPVINGWLLYEIWKERRRRNNQECRPIIPMPDLPVDGSEYKDRDKEITKMLILVTLSYWVMTTGFNFMQAGIIDVYHACTPHELVRNSTIYTIFMLLFYLNHASNFFLYCISAKPYRDEVKCMFARGYRAIAMLLRTIVTKIQSSFYNAENDKRLNSVRVSYHKSRCNSIDSL
ncbi:uncharacterized protein LOC106153321 [Lingula anatina]|uniref:Uncharacterized protein LOC106153321 n=1 Tax=Lingula anatina TaxID=7574 RepID=A0A1S3HB20_LINAN|nr:uncharacterized protein LOC106153321 [Lingula anatina]XP_013382656.1 uncharacterized protein LOC106153321 [Lingula anatina]|eukprot:XP_013382655.1 uncharacterized protein LOC106153321 [Lingula anatina]